MSSAALQHDSSLSSLSDVQRRVLNALAEGITVTAAAAQNGVHRTTIHHWIRTQKEFAAAADAAKADYQQQLSDELKEMSATALSTLRKLMTDADAPASVQLKAALAVLERLPNGWSLPEQLPAAAQPEPASEPPVRTMPQLLARVRETYETNLKSSQIPRNAPCPCGSGQKYKRCCGSDAPPVLGV